MADYRTLDDVTVEYFAQHPEEINIFLHEAYVDYLEDGDLAVLLSALRVIFRMRNLHA